MEFEEVIKKRRSIRKFKNQPVEKNLVEKLITAATLAPSACNTQGWKFIIVNNDELKKEIFDAGGSVLIKNSPLGILVLYDNRTLNLDYQDHIQSASAAIQNINLAATNIGLGTCWICHLPTPKKLRKILKMPAYYSPVAYILLGYPEIEPHNMPRKYDLRQVMSYNEFSPNWPKEKINIITLNIKRLLIKIYYFTPTFIKKIFLNRVLDKNFVKKFKN